MLIAQCGAAILAMVLAASTWLLHRREPGALPLVIGLAGLALWCTTLSVAQALDPEAESQNAAYRLAVALMFSCVSVVSASFFVLCLRVGARSSVPLFRIRAVAAAVGVEVLVVMTLLGPGYAFNWFDTKDPRAPVAGGLFMAHAAFCFLLGFGGVLALMTRWDAFDRPTRGRCLAIVVLFVAIVVNEIGRFGATPFLVLVGLAAAYVAQFRLGWHRQVRLGRTLVADRLADPMIVVDNDGQVIDANHQARTLFARLDDGQSLSEILGTSFRLDDQHDSLVTVAEDGGHVDLLVRSTRVTHRSDLLGWAVTLRDIDSLVYRQNDPAGDYRMLRRRRGDQRTDSDNLAVLMRHDPLTAASTRVAFESVLEAAVASSRRDGQGLQVLMLDVDKFKGINDLHGHLAGDVILREVVDRVAGFIGPGEMIARFGGDEFVLLLRRSSDLAAQEAAESMCAKVSASPVAGELGLDITVSIGVAGFSGGMTENGSSLLAAADQSMYLVKRAGGNGVGHGTQVHAGR